MTHSPDRKHKKTAMRKHRLLMRSDYQKEKIRVMMRRRATASRVADGDHQWS
jgi:hypothetical protein